MRAEEPDEERGEPAPWRRAPCSSDRAQSGFVPLIIFLVIGINYLPYVVWGIERARAGVAGE